MISDARKTVRKSFAALLTSALVGTGKLAYTVKAYRWGGIQGQSPVVIVSSYGTLRQPLTFQGTRPAYQLQVDVFVTYSTEDATYTEETAEDLLDDIEQVIAGVIAANQRNTNWEAITQSDWSTREDIAIGGADYIREYMIVEFS